MCSTDPAPGSSAPAKHIPAAHQAGSTATGGAVEISRRRALGVTLMAGLAPMGLGLLTAPAHGANPARRLAGQDDADRSDWGGPLAPDMPFAKAYDDAAAALAAADDNPMIRWQYRVWCQTGYRTVGEAGTGQPIDTPAPDPRRDLITPLGFVDQASAKDMPEGGVRFMDNAWYFGDDVTGLVVVRTPADSLLVFDTVVAPRSTRGPFPDIRAAFLDQASVAGLDPTKITHVFMGHHHSDHVGGANLIRDEYAPGAKFVMGQPDAEIVRQRLADLRNRRSEMTKEEYEQRLASIPRRIDKTVKAYPGHTVGMEKIKAGGIEVTAMVTPGHTVGQMNVIVPVQHGGQTHKLIVWSGNDAPLDQVSQYAISTEFILGVAKLEGADAFINTHAYQGAAFAHLRDLKEDPTTINHFLMGVDGVQRHLGIFANAQRALEQRLIDGTWVKL